MRIGKIAMLPGAVMEELNRRMDREEVGPVILEWLNGLPEVRQVLQDGFGGAPINMPNLTAWRQGRFREWQLRREVFMQAAELAQVGKRIDTQGLAGDLLATVTAHYASLLSRWDGGLDKEFDQKTRRLGRLTRDFVTIRKVVGELVEVRSGLVGEGAAEQPINAS